MNQTRLAIRNMGEALRRLKILSDRADRIKAMETAVNAEWEEIEEFITREAERSGVSKWSGEGVSVSVENDLRVSYDPALWEEMLGWAVASGNTAIVQRRMGESAVKALIDSGQGTPPGVRLSVYSKVGVRRK